jgi:hypothetical protein
MELLSLGREAWLPLYRVWGLGYRRELGSPGLSGREPVGARKLHVLAGNPSYLIEARPSMVLCPCSPCHSMA